MARSSRRSATRQPAGWGRRVRARRAFSLAEALVALTILALAGSTLLLATDSAIQSNNEALDQTLARGIAQRILDDALGHRYVERGNSPFQTPLGIESGESSSPRKRILFDDTDDFFVYWSHPIQDRWGITLGQGDDQGGQRHPHFRARPDFFDRFWVVSLVTYVDEDNPAVNLGSSTPSGVRAIEVRVYKDQDQGPPRLLTKLRRVYGYVPPPA